MKEKIETGEITEAEFRKAMAEKVVTFFERTDIYEKCQELEVLSYEEFKDFIIRINGMVRDIPIKDRKADGENVTIMPSSLLKGDSRYIEELPHKKDKEDLLLQTYNALTELKDKNDLRYFLPLMINAIHMFSDGNGRTSRLFYALLKKHDSKDDFCKDVEISLMPGSRFEYINMDPSLISTNVKRIIMEKHYEEYEEFGLLKIIPSYLPLEKISKIAELETSRTEEVFIKLAINGYLSKNNLLDKCSDEEGISEDLMEEVLTEEDVESILEEFYKLKKEEAETIIDIFVHPDLYKTFDESQTIKDKFISSIKEDF